MMHIDLERLRSLGLTPRLAALAAQTHEEAIHEHGAPVPALPESGEGGLSWTLMRVSEVHRESVRLHDGHSEHAAHVWPRLARRLAEQDTALSVGDWAVVSHVRDDGHWVRAQVPAQTHIARRDADGRRHAVVSNVDTALLVMGLDDDFNLRRLERYLALVQGSGVMPVLVLTKADVMTAWPEVMQARLDALGLRKPPDLPVLAVNALLPQAAQALSAYLGSGQTLVLLGSSGAGKSTLTNTLLGVEVQDTGAVRAHDSRGKHTTTARSLHALPGGACVIDTPGLRTLRPDLDEDGLKASFGDVQQLAPLCRFRDCRHLEEPGCAVRERLDGDRLRNYHKLVREARRDSRNPLERQQILAQWKVRGRAGKARAKAKRESG